MKIGDRVRIVGLPENLPSDGDVNGLNSASLLRQCLGRVFPVMAFNELGYAELHVGDVIGQEPYMSSVWLEPEFLVVVED